MNESRVIGKRVFFFGELESTQQEAENAFISGWIKEGDLVSAAYQTQGRGQGNNSWQSGRGLNILVSFVLEPSFLPPENQFMLNKSVSLGVADMVRNLVPGSPVFVKWPNDIILGDGKVAGILMNHTIVGNSIGYSVIGIGLNVNQCFFPPFNPVAVSLAQLLRHELDLEGCLDLLCETLTQRYLQLREQKETSLDKDYLEILYRLGKTNAFELHGRPVKGRIAGVNRFGQLILKTDIGTEEICDVREIRYL
ncbi:MAG: biotin--[acetyl-CoA-carboxylase] ligase [Bacteroidales bacterium]|nr:biotin--[acetyl-CoA-carboxylase] ligase [Bacteroidales bacterium]